MNRERDRAMAIAMLAEAFSVRDMTSAKVKIYDQALQKVPHLCLEPMTQRAITTRSWFPKVAELLEDAEYARLELIRTLGDFGCASCEDHKGWIAMTQDDGTTRMERCGCWKRLQEKRLALDVGTEPLALPAPDGPAA